MKPTHCVLLPGLLLLTGGVAIAHDNHAMSGLHIEQQVQAPLKDINSLSVLTVTLDPGYREPLHTHPGEEVIYVLSGSGQLWLDGEALPLQVGDFYHVRAGQQKAIDNSGSGAPLVVLAYLALEADKPILELVQSKSE